MWFKIYASVIFIIYIIQRACSNCIFQEGKYDLSALDWSWPVPGPEKNGTKISYKISLCRPLNFSSIGKEGCFHSSVCQISNQGAISYGNFINNVSDYAIADNADDNGFSLYLLTTNHCSSSHVYRAVINFVCGQNLGIPELILQSECQVNFFWRTSAACHNKPKQKQVPCYVIDDNGNIKDLSYLIKRNGGYFVNTPTHKMDFIINVCADIVLNDQVTYCPYNSSACRLIKTEGISFGHPYMPLQKKQDDLVLIYINNHNTDFPSNCKLNPKTTIIFKCPQRGFSQPPKLISDNSCHYEVLWETEYACSENMLKADLKTCQFTQEQHGVEIDLSPLKHNAHYPVYIVPSNTSESVKFALNVCGGLGDIFCNGKHWKSTAVCMNDTDHESSIIVGKTDGSELKYVDGEILLIYPKGAICFDQTHQTSIINFRCNSNAGNGFPLHISSDNCTHLFEWETKHACLKHPVEIPCSLTYNKKKINLEKLILKRDTFWEAIDERPLNNSDNAQYFINVCSPLYNLSNQNKCDNDSSACVIYSNGTQINLGKFVASPFYDTLSNSIKLEYIGGSFCNGNKSWTSSIKFICSPSHIISKPILVKIDNYGCKYYFEWYTIEACSQDIIKGSNCKIFDPNLDINYDLSSLKSKVYMIDTENYIFYLSICTPIEDSPCSQGQNATNVGSCQVEKGPNPKHWKIGESTSNLTYRDGVINLVYTSGDPYSDKNQISRITNIVFICDYTVGTGSPYFIEEDHFAYIFHWYTSLVCLPSITTECVTHDPISNLVYDLSSLTLLDRNWIALINVNGKKQKIYINVCHSLALPSKCDPKASACMVESDGVNETVVIPNLGQVTEPPSFKSDYLTLNYSNGDSCIAFGENRTYTTIIHFLCSDNEIINTGPRFLSKVGNCIYTFLWTTKAACPTGELTSKNTCQLNDPNSGFIFDLTSLKKVKQSYIISHNSRTFHFNICDKVVEGCFIDGQNDKENVSVCETDNNGTMISILGVVEPYILSYSSDRDLTLVYTYYNHSINDKFEVIITFPCSNSTSDPEPKFIQQEGKKYFFEIKTSLTCMNTNFHCNFIENGNEYDLNPLAKYTGNWEVVSQNSRYHINFCRPLNKVLEYNCPGGDTAACETSISLNQKFGHNLGSERLKPTVINNGTVVVHYSYGSYCENGQFRHSTTINLYCSNTEGEMQFLGATPECEYIFSLNTPVACPLSSSHGTNCIVQEPRFGYKFNLNPLKSKNSNYNVTVGEYIYYFNICDRLNGFTDTCENSSVCQTKPKNRSFVKSLGLPNDKLTYRDGVISLEYKGGSGNCHGQYNRTTKITFTCHHGREDKDGPSFIAEAEDCVYLFEWPTIHACPPFDIIECSCEDDQGNYYDLSKLSLPNSNYYIRHPFMQNKTFVINVCRSIVHSPDSYCPYISAACLLDNYKSHNNSFSLGHANYAPYIENGKIKIHYINGDICKHEENITYMQTIIEFNCDFDKRDSQPEYIGNDGCTYYFEWSTVYACPFKSIEKMNNCTVKDPFTKYTFNLLPLQKNEPYLVENGNHKFFLNVCGIVKSTKCEMAGMCQEEISGERYWSGGKPNRELYFQNGFIFLNYSNGDACHKGRFERNTIIQFKCGKGFGEPLFLYESEDCTYFFLWETELACQSLVHCAIKNGSHFYDLTKLANSYFTAGSDMLNDDSTYYISVCNPLPLISDVSCPPDTAICKVTKDKETSMIITENLGKVEHPPFIDFEGHATSIYSNGSFCHNFPDINNRARIIFLCNPEAGLGEPVLIDIVERCVYIFEWKTNVVCPENPIPFSYTSCNYTDLGKGIYFDLIPLRKINGYYMVKERNEDALFLLNVCEAVNVSQSKKCENSGICLQKGNMTYNFGLAATQKFSFDGTRLRLMLFDGDDCPSGKNGKRSSEIFFVCDPMAGKGEPLFHSKHNCLAIFIWRTSLVCQNMLNRCTFNINAHHYDFNLLSSLSHNWDVKDSKNNIYWINLCQGVQKTQDTYGCANTAAVCLRDNDGSHISLGLVQTMEVKPTNTSDLLLNFFSGDSRACKTLKSGKVLTPVTRLFMRCGSTLGSPQIISGPDTSCFYDFVWQTSLACPEKMNEIKLQENGTLFDNRFNYYMNINDILDHTYNVPGFSSGQVYTYVINLNGAFKNEINNPCSNASVCQMKPGTDFRRDVGSYDTKIFYIRGSELHLVLHSNGRRCGKNPSKNVTTLINMQCSSSANIGEPRFLYESGNCDYLFEWNTIVVCPNYHRKKTSSDSESNARTFIGKSSSQKIWLGIGLTLIILCIAIAFLLIKPERRAFVSSKFRGLFGRASMPYFRYKRGDILTELQSDF